MRLALHDFLVDLLGGLVPGILFTIAVLVAFVPAVESLHGSLCTPVPQSSAGSSIRELVEATRDTPNMVWISVLLLGLLVSYVIGHLFYRRDPKGPDREGFELLARQHPSDAELREYATARGKKLEGEEDTRRREWLRINFACATAEECEFPYPNLADYLGERGHHHLLPLVPWKRRRMSRSKTFINRLKIRLSYYHPEKCRMIVRNEAHVRLATSTWYVAKGLLVLGAAAAILVTASLGIALGRKELTTWWCALSWYVGAVLWPLFVFVIAMFCRRMTSRFIHYQRLREAFYVLELAYTAFRDTPDLLASPDVFREQQQPPEDGEELVGDQEKSAVDL